MRNEWFGDKRDHLKWTSLLLLAQGAGIQRIVQIAMWTNPQPPEFRILNIDYPQDDAHDITGWVSDFFHQHNDLGNIQALGQQLGIEIEVWLQPFTRRAREAYFRQITERIRESDVPTIWFFDPDTGIAPVGGASDKHVRVPELAVAFDELPRGDFLACYQHAWRAHDWYDQTLDRFRRACNVPAEHVRDFVSIHASDVLILAVQKP
ncbi:MAG: hypothetical protein F4W95_02800 [Chloroflexi bacterium]|nr:hypothetical protein [Chloroflexota bacterium]MYD47396.1 hypothetical protein [Chloroflexota bacterium]